MLRGENKAALEIARRTDVAVDLTARYEQYGMSEQALWDRIYEMDDWWRESTWYAVTHNHHSPVTQPDRPISCRLRLITRELPDL